MHGSPAQEPRRALSRHFRQKSGTDDAHALMSAGYDSNAGHGSPKGLRLGALKSRRDADMAYKRLWSDVLAPTVCSG